MATFKLDDNGWKQLDFPAEVWGEKPEYTADFITNLSPSVVRITSLSENKDFSWFYGRFISTNGRIRLSYPEVIEPQEATKGEEVLIIPNYCFSYYPFLKVVAEGKKFQGWFNYSSGELLQKEPVLIISETDFIDVTTFAARFKA